ncbi:indolepyruvate oxidoreductase subunit beta [Fervidicoccus fontis]|uniref:Indolepyruvate oxidoreductase subunit beta n=1 Tax=Fervidicoccus fontis TaxID=683846 RepID=A0A843AJA6_9CREN|nr:indolepyruvate oxidoreductase subunit beta [Fervidicoccus fontis]MBE9391659.1 indolepyruvate oxidoreductase subunit beta [Fervidicoccus fontis]
MSNETKQVIVTGIGGQGNVLMARILVAAAIDSGLEGRVGELYGSAQRGGPVASHVKFGKKAFSPIILEHEADAIISLELSESLRRLNMLKPNGAILINDYRIIPSSVMLGESKYPTKEEVIEAIKKVTDRICIIPATDMAKQLGNARIANVLMLGAFRVFFDTGIDREYFIQAIKENVRPKYVELNIKAFEKGEELGRELCKAI